LLKENKFDQSYLHKNVGILPPQPDNRKES